MKKFIALILAIGSALILALPDPVFLIDEGIAIIVLVNSMAVLGLDLRRFFGIKGAKKEDSKPIDV